MAQLFFSLMLWYFSDCEVQNSLHGVDTARWQFICLLNADQIIKIAEADLRDATWEEKKRKSLCVIFLEAAPHLGHLFLESMEGRSLKAAAFLLLFSPKLTCFSFSHGSDFLLIITSILDVKMWRANSTANTSDFQSCATLWRLPNKRVSSWKTSSLVQKENRMEKNREHPGLRNEVKIARSLCVMAAPLKGRNMTSVWKTLLVWCDWEQSLFD